ncbi:ATP-binding cassette domain-containing protein [Saprospiraceae bacterium]|jgi:ABC-2 type transport system ATP-binding protein|nr:ATP-binding cassette domain-containing protein [Bacteroidota bacterium]MDB4727513.1 ATP-binding cassette domain-containing protein [Saprospiraceae bacterium]MDF1866980.1 ATP-binding cassette domain-containing protein [Saprospiraceae bacterium]
MSILKLENVVKTYQKHIAVNEVSFEVKKGGIFGLLGPNGAGKTSLIRIITTITGADEGTIFLDGEKLNSSHPGKIGYMPEERGLYKKMKVGEQIMYLAQLKGLSKKGAKEQIQYWFKRFGIEDWWDKKVEELSKGMQQKVQFIATVIHQPKLLILDEPFSGLDPINTNLIKDEIRRLNSEGVSIIFSTHRMEQVEEICEDIVLINNGKNILEGKVSELKHRFKENLFRIEYEGNLPSDLNAMDEANDNFEIVSNESNVLTIKVTNETVSNQVLNHLIQNGVFINNFNEILPSLNEIFIKRVNAEA